MEKSINCFILQHALLCFVNAECTKTPLFLYPCTWHLGDLEQLTIHMLLQSCLLHLKLISARTVIVGGWSQTISPFIFCCMYVPSNGTSILQFKFSVLTCIQPLLVFPTSHTHWGACKGEFESIHFTDMFLITVYPYRNFQKCWCFYRNQSRISGVLSLLCELAHVGNYSHYNKKDFLYPLFLKDEISWDCGDNSQSLPCTGFWWRDCLLDVLTGNQMILSCVSGLFESWILSWGIVSAVIANFLLERFMIK